MRPQIADPLDVRFELVQGLAENPAVLSWSRDSLKIQRSAPSGWGVMRRLARTMTSSAVGSRPASWAISRSWIGIWAIVSMGRLTGFQPSASIPTRRRAAGAKAAR
jgi:hypothetical protein